MTCGWPRRSACSSCAGAVCAVPCALCCVLWWRVFMWPRSIARRSRCASVFLVWAPLCSVWGAFCVVWVCVCPHTRAYGGGCFCGPSCPVGGRSLGSHVLLLLHPRKSRRWYDVPACSRARLKPLNTVASFPVGNSHYPLSAALPESASDYHYHHH